ncbi:MAG: DUF72 domain-containing protein [Candidatus Pacebacteria bacterium]|nr:DUF72 domain-containing protein [Candidatus Paceibacterota bacterium]
METQDIAVGIAGWAYPDWDGFVYPRGTKDQLRFVAQYVDMVEINTTFYRAPTPRLVYSWHQRTRDIRGFFFSAKLTRDITHDQIIRPDLVKAFHEAFRPMTDEGRLHHLLAQFRWDFDDGDRQRRHIDVIVQHFGDMTNLSLELRHRSWEAPDALSFLSGLGVTVANLDYPLAKNSFGMRESNVGEHAYMRLHGRNAAAWFDPKAGRDETYNYCYAEAEIEEIAARAGAIASMSKSLTLVANNHYQGKEMLNALELKAKFSGGKVFTPPDLAEKYPRLKKIARSKPLFPEQKELF